MTKPTTPTAEDLLLGDPLDEVTRRERRSLLGVSVIGIVLVKTGLVPSKITALGIEFSPADQRSLLLVFSLIVFYFLAAFIVYGVSDYLAWKIALRRQLNENIRTLLDQRRPEKIRPKDTVAHDVWKQVDDRYRSKLNPTFVSVTRALFEFLLPIVVGIYAIVLLLRAT